MDRLQGRGPCLGGALAKIASSQLHFWEEPVVSGDRGSGTIFFSGCNMHCVYCQNHEISQKPAGREVDTGELAGIMLDLQGRGAHNVNLVSPTQFTPQTRLAIIEAKERGLSIPVLWNSNAFEKAETLRSLEGIVDVFMPDFRYAMDDAAVKYSGAPGYAGAAKIAISEMFRQVGHLKTADGVVERGLLVRVLVLPGNVGRAELILEWIASEIGPETHVSLMGQYYPACRAGEFPELNRGLGREEYALAESALEKLGMENGFVQDVGSDSSFTPDFSPDF